MALPSEELLMQKFAQARKSSQGRFGQIKQQSQEDLDRQFAKMGMSGSGAQVKAIGNQNQELARQQEENLGGIDQAEAGAQQAIAAQKEAEAHQAALQKEQLAQQESQFARTFEQSGAQFQQQFGLAQQQFGLAQSEFDQSVLNNYINAATALSESDLQNPNKWRDLSGTLAAFGYKGGKVVQGANGNYQWSGQNPSTSSNPGIPGAAYAGLPFSF